MMGSAIKAQSLFLRLDKDNDSNPDDVHDKRGSEHVVELDVVIGQDVL